MIKRSDAKSWLLVIVCSTVPACENVNSDPPTEFPVRIGEARVLPSPAGPGSGEPNLSLAGDTILMSWLEPATEGHALRFSRLIGDRWEEPRTVVSRTDLFVNWADFPSVIQLPGGELAAHWLQYSGPGTYSYDVLVSTSHDGGVTWSQPARPHSDGTPTEHGFVSLFAVPGTSDVAAVWLDGRAYADSTEEKPFMSLRGAVLGPDGRWTDQQVLDDSTCDCCQTSAARTTRGIIVAYRGRTEAEIRDIRVSRYEKGRWSDPVTVHDDGWEIPACPVNGPSVSARGDTVAIAWFTAAADIPRVWTAFSTDGGLTFEEPILIDGDRPLGRVSASTIEGGAVITWLAAADSGAKVLARAVGSKSPAAPPVVIGASSAERASGFPSAVTRGQEIVAAWTLPADPRTIRVITVPLLRSVGQGASGKK